MGRGMIVTLVGAVGAVVGVGRSAVGDVGHRRVVSGRARRRWLHQTHRLAADCRRLGVRFSHLHRLVSAGTCWRRALV